MKKLTRILAAMVMISASFAAQAVIVSYQFSGTTSSGTDTVTGEVFLEETDLIANSDIGLSFTDWYFTWTSNGATLTSSFADGFSSELFVIDANLEVANVSLCTGACAGTGTNWPEIFIGISNWNASIAPSGNCCNGGTGAWSGPVNVSVPEPGMLGLFGLSLLGLAAVRRRKTQPAGWS